MKLKQDQGAIRQNEEKLKKVLDVYEQRLGESQFLAGNEFTLADLSHLPNTHYLVNATDMGELFTSRENVGRWWSEISSRDSWRRWLGCKGRLLDLRILNSNCSSESALLFSFFNVGLCYA